MATRLLCCSGSLDGGGSERQLWQLATGVDASRFEPEIYLHYCRGIYLPRVPERIPVHAFWSDAAYTRSRLPGQTHRRQVGHLRQVIQQRQIDVVYDRTFHMTLVTGPACRKTSTPRVSAIVSPPSLDFMRSPERFRWLKKWLLRRAYSDPLCCVVAVSDSVASDAIRFYGLSSERIETIPSPVDIPAVERAAAEFIPDGLNGSSGQVDLRIVVVGRLSAEKGQRLAIEAVARLKQQRRELQVELMLAGEGPDRAELEQLTKSLAIADRVHFTGQLANPYPLIRGADLLCIPSQYEGLPNVALEALCLKTPILATICSSSLRDLLGDRERGVLTPVGDVSSLAKEILDRVEHPVRWQQRAERGSQWVRTHHGLANWLERMQSLLERKAGNRQKRP